MTPTSAPPRIDYAGFVETAVRVEKQRAKAIGQITRQLRHERHGAWTHTSQEGRREFAARVLFQRIRLNRAGLLRWRREPAAKRGMR